jgi:RimJ/RimL family protein N-acetyltransferase
MEDIKLIKFKDVDFPFMYELVVAFLKTDLSVTFLDIPPYKEFIKAHKNDGIIRYIVTNLKGQQLGFVQLLKNSEVGYFIKQEAQGKGIASQAVKLLLEYHPRKRFFATIHNENRSSIKLVEKLGFKPKAIIYENIQK